MLAACGSTHGAASSEASSLKANPTVSAAVNKAKIEALSCIKTGGGHKVVIMCLEDLAPKPLRAQVGQCELKAFTSNMFSHSGRVALKEGTPEANCLVAAGV
jgi:hypothetical protein